MSTNRMVAVGTAAAREAIAVAAEVPDDDAATLRVTILELLRAQAETAVPDDGDEDLLAAYRRWLTAAVALYASGDTTLIREYTVSGAVLDAETQLAQVRDQAGPDAAAARSGHE